MIRGTNQDFKFKMPYEYKDVPLITVTFWQNGNDGPEESRPLPIIKYHDDCEPSKDNNKEITVNSVTNLDGKVLTSSVNKGNIKRKLQYGY